MRARRRVFILHIDQAVQRAGIGAALLTHDQRGFPRERAKQYGAFDLLSDSFGNGRFPGSRVPKQAHDLRTALTVRPLRYLLDR